MRPLLAVLLAALVAAAVPAQARTLHVGPDGPFRTLAAAAAAARRGDVVQIAAGDYAQCAVWRADGLTIAGAGMAATRIHDVSCEGKGLFVITGRNVTVRDLTLAGATVRDRNGAGIRAEGTDLTVERVGFENNENGILSMAAPGATITVRDSVFLRDGVCAIFCAHGIYAGHIGHLVVQHSRFAGIREGHHIKSRALATDISDCDISDGPDGTASYQIDVPNGGRVSILRNRLEKGPHTENAETAIAIGEEGVSNPTPSILVADNSFRNDGPVPAAFLRNRTTTAAVLRGNRLDGAVIPLVGPGTVQP